MVRPGVAGVTPDPGPPDGGAPALSLHEIVDAHRRYEHSVRRVCRRYLRSAEAADDATQETFLRAAVVLRTVRPDVLGAYLHTIARNVCLEELRRQRRRAGDGGPDAPAVLTDPESIVMERSFIDQVWRRLTARDRVLLILRLAGYSYEEIAQRLRISVKAVEVGLMRARRRARRVLDGMPALVTWGMAAWRRRRRGRGRRARSIAVLRGAGRSAAWKLAVAAALLPALPTAPALWRLAVGPSLAAGGDGASAVGLTAALAASAEAPLSGIDVSSLTVSPEYGRDHAIYASGRRVDCVSTCPVLVRSGDGGHSWQALPARGFGGGTVLLAPSRRPDPVILAAAPEGLERSDDGGRSFRTVVRSAGAIAVAPTSPPGGALVAIGAQRIVLYHAGSGAVTPGPSLPTGVQPTGISFTADGRHLLVAAMEFRGSAREQADVLRCDLVGSCRRILADSQASALRLVTLPSARGVAVVSPHRLYLASPDGAAVRLVRVFAAEELALVAAAADGSAGGVRLVAELQRGGGGPSQLAESSDLGHSFRTAAGPQAASGFTALAALPDGRVVVAVTVGAVDLAWDAGLRCSLDGGATWMLRC